MELYISDHPLDCLTCPTNGDCELQDTAELALELCAMVLRVKIICQRKKMNPTLILPLTHQNALSARTVCVLRRFKAHLL